MNFQRSSRFPLGPVGLFTLLTLLIAAPARANEEIGFIETFALAEDRAKALEQLIPGTEEYYYFHALHAQNLGDHAKVSQLFEPWIERYGETPRYREIRHREALLRYREDERGSLAYLIRELGLSFNHQQERLNARPDFPTAIAPGQVTWEIYQQQAFRASDTVSQFEDSGLDRLLREDIALDQKRLRDLLGRLRYPDYPRLVGLIASDLRSNVSGGFGEFEIHRRLLPSQLDELLRLNPNLKNNPNFVHLRMRHQRPSPDVDWKRDATEREAYLTRLWNYAKELDPAFNSLKAHTLYQLLQHHQRAGNYPRDLFLEYLHLPRQLAYVEPNLLRDAQQQRFPVDLNANFAEITACPPIQDDEALVRDYLLSYFVDDADWEGFARFIRSDYLKPLFAEAKLTHGVGDAEKWFSLLSPSVVQALKDRVDIEFATGNPETFAPGDPVSLDVDVKNAGKLIVKVYEINALNFYLEEKRELSTDLDLDGLIPNEETSHEFNEPPIRRVRRTFTFDSLTNRRGAWVIEFIGNGRSSRALVRKGGLQYLAETTPAGIAARILTQNNEPAKSPAIWFGGREYRPEAESKDGLIVLPFSNQPGDQFIVITDGDFASLETLNLPAENYALDAGIHLDRENLLPGQFAKVAIRPNLSINGEPATAGVLEDTKLVIRSTDHDGIESVTEVPGFALFDDRESTHEFRVPERLASLNVELRATIEKLSDGGNPVELKASKSFEVNSIDTTEYIADSHLSRIGGSWILEVLGKTGEPIIDRAVQVSVKHRDFTNPLHFSLKTNQQGRVALSTLLGHERVEVNGEGLPSRSWDLSSFDGGNYLPASVNAAAGEVIQIPVTLDHDGPLAPSDFVLLETRADGFVADAFGNAEMRDGLLQISGLAPGDYELYLRDAGERVVIRVTKEISRQNGYALSQWRHLQIKNPAPLQIASLETADGKLNLRLVNADSMTRVHVVATRFLPEFSLASLGNPGAIEPITIQRGSVETLYLSGRDIGEEYRYILERRAAKRFPGNLLTRPGLLLNPWALRDTETAIDDAKDGDEYARKEAGAASARAGMAGGRKEMAPVMVEGPVSPNYDFLRNQAPLVYNLAPDPEGRISLDLADFGDRQQIHVLAVNSQNAAYRQLSLAEEKGVALRDLRLTRNLDPARHFSQRQKVTVLKNGEVLVLPDVRSSELETYDTLAGVWTALSGVHDGTDQAKLAEFAFLLDWPEMAMEKKRELYSKFACHELNFFLSRRDPEFFASTVRPYLTNKRDKTFFDDYLIEADLSKYTQAWAFGRLNMVERILLARRLGGDEPAATARHASDLLALKPVEPEQRTYFFRSALRGKATSGIAGGARVEMLGFVADEVALEESRGLGLRQLGEVVKSQPMAAADGMPVIEMAPASPPAVDAIMDPVEQFDLLERKAGEAESRGMEMLSTSVADLKKLRAKNRALFRKLEATKEWAENNYYHLLIEQQVADLISANPFWRDYAAWDGKGGFYSREFPTASRNFSEMMLALTVLDVPFAAEKHDLTIEEGVLTLTAKSPVIAFHEEVEETAVAEERTPILVSQNFFRASDRYAYVDGEQSDKFVTEEFLTGVLYGGQVVATNPTSSTRNLDLLLQIPRGALPANGSNYTETQQVRLEPFSTQKLDYFFYFPAASAEGEAFPHYPVHVSRAEEVVAWADPVTFKVVDQLSHLDKASWDYLSQFGTEEEVIAFLEQNNVYRLDLSRIAWRCREKVDFFRRVVGLLNQRHAWDATLWSYGLYHNDVAVTRQYLLHREDFLAQCGQWLESDLVSIDPVARHWYQHLEYQPLVNARSHRLGRDQKILNDRFRSQYQSYVKVLGYQSEFPPSEQLGIAYYLFLQDRVEEALDWLGKVEQAGGDAVDSPLQFDYLKAYAAFYREAPEEGAKIAEKYADYPVDRWRDRFAQVSEQAKEVLGAVEGEPAPAEGEGDRDQQQEALAAGEANIEMKTEGRKVTIDYRNLDKVRVNYYEMDLEFLFSSNPFVSEDSGRFSYIRPNVTLLKDLPKGESSVSFEIPEQFASSNVLVEIVAGGKKRSAAVYANDLKVQLVENFGRLEVHHADSGKPMSKVYVKVYGRFSDGSVRFFKDGYTDLRGKFDYVSLNTNELDDVQQLSLLILSEEDGALVREVAPPQR
ncbi:MAG: hypothetical protein KDN20_00710 [Verrucomicrobiae bacterium]|nr:hypothetical protein [Verrucomicrobiae bacterium]